MKWAALEIPDRIFGVDSANIVIFVPLLITVLVAIISINLVFVPSIDELLAMQNNLTSLQKDTQTVLEKTRYLQSIDPLELQKNADSLSSALMPQKNAYILVEVLRRVITKFGFQIDSFLINPGRVDNNVATVTTNKGVLKIPIKIEISGPKSGYLELVKSIERTLPLLSISNFKMSSSGNLAKLNLEISAFYLDDTVQFDINKLTLSDLTLKKSETDLVTNLGSYEILERGGDDLSKPAAEFRKYQPRDPFSL